MTPATAKTREFDPNNFLATIGSGRKILAVPKKRRGVHSRRWGGRGLLHPKGQSEAHRRLEDRQGSDHRHMKEGDFFGEGALAGQIVRMGSAAAMTDCELLRVDKKAMMNALHREHAFSDLFVAYLLARNIRYEEDLVDQLFNSSEKRLARVLLLLAHFGKEGVPETVIPKISQETLAEMVGTTRSRVSFFMNRFRKLGFIHYNGGLQVHSSLLNVVLHD